MIWFSIVCMSFLSWGWVERNNIWKHVCWLIQYNGINDGATMWTWWKIVLHVLNTLKTCVYTIIVFSLYSFETLPHEIQWLNYLLVKFWNIIQELNKLATSCLKNNMNIMQSLLHGKGNTGRGWPGPNTLKQPDPEISKTLALPRFEKRL